MGRTLLVGASTGVWREWLREHRATRDYVCLDPADSDHGWPGRVTAFTGDKCHVWGFVGSLSALRSPHLLVALMRSLLESVREDAVVELFPFRPSPLRLQLARVCAELVAPEQTLVDRRAHLEKKGWPGAIDEVDLPDALPYAVTAGQRKARWLQMLEQSDDHVVDLRCAALDGLRLGSGVPVPTENLRKYGFVEPLHGELAGQSLLVVSDVDVTDVEVSRALDAVHASKASIVSSKSYENLICSFAREDGSDFGMGRIDRIDFAEWVAYVQCTAVAPAPVRTLRVGGLRVDREGKELAELRPWEA